VSERSTEKPVIHPTALVDPSAEFEDGVQIGPFCVIGKNVRLGAGTVLHAHVQIMENTRLGKNCQVFGGAIIGGPPQDVKYKNEPSYVIIGDNNILREYVTVHRATGEENVTRIGDNNMLMAYAHVAHNCDIGSHVTIASYVGISGHVTVEDHANFGGITGVHQYCRIGKYAMIGGLSGVVQDIPPFMLANGRPARVYDINKIGLRRAGISPKVRNELRQAHKLLYCSNLNMSEALATIGEEIDRSPELDHLLEFIHISRNGKNMRGNDET
jgi:UDP-N-acetylglucosamine acyltransferase